MCQICSLSWLSVVRSVADRPWDRLIQFRLFEGKCKYALSVLGLLLIPVVAAATDDNPGKHTQTLADLSVVAQGAISTAIGRDQVQYHATAGAEGLSLTNPAHGFTARLQSGALHIVSGADTWKMSLERFGYGSAMQAVGAPAVKSSDNRVDCAYGGIAAWYVNGPVGLEQGFTVAPSADGAASLTVALRLHGSLAASANAAGDSLTLSRSHGAMVLRYCGLSANDSTGRTLPASMEVLSAGDSGQELLIHVNTAGAQGTITIDPFVQAAKLTASDGAAHSDFGSSVAISGNTIVVGAPFATIGSNAQQGAAYIFVHPDSGWANNMAYTAKLTSSDGASGNRFGNSVSISGNTIVVSAPCATVGGNAVQGAAYAYVEPASGWASMTQTAKLTASDGAAYDYFGWSTGISGNTIVVGTGHATVGGNAFQGTAYVFVQPASGWGNMTQTAKLTASDGAANDEFGNSVGTSGNTIIVGANGATIGGNESQGAAYVFVEPVSGWADVTETAKLTASDGAAADVFGFSVGISGNTIVVGAFRAENECGAAYVFVQPAPGWANMTQTAKLIASDGAAYDEFGNSVAISGNTILIGAPDAMVGGNEYQGAAYVFVQPAPGWTNMTQTAKLTSSDGAAYDDFGMVALSGNTLAVGAADATVSGNVYQGAAYVFVGPPIYTLGVQSTPATGLSIGSSTGQSGTTNYTKTGVAYGSSVNLQAPATDPAGYTFSQWTVNGAAQTPGQKSITFTMDAAVTAVAYYTSKTGYTLSVNSSPPVKLVISSSTGHGGTTNYKKTGVGNGTSVNLQAPAADPAGYAFSQWAVNGAAQSPGQKSITFTMDAAVKAVARYTPNTGYTLSVQSTSPTGVFINSSTFHSGITNYKVPGVTYGTSVNLQAAVTDPAGCTFLQWTVNGAAQTPGQKSITFTMDAAVTAVAHYTSNIGYTLSVESTPPSKLSISSSTGNGGTTNYTKTGVGNRTSVNLQAPAADPAGYTFSQWAVNGAAQTPGQKSITFTMDAAVTAVAHYTSNIGYTLSVQSTPPVKLVISSSTGQNGTTKYAIPGVAEGTSVDLTAPATDPAGYTFSQWTVNGAAQPAGQKSITFTMDAAVTAVAQYTLNGYALTVESTPPTRLSIGSSTGHKGATNYYMSKGIAQGTSVNLQAPATDPKGYTFSQWTVNGVAQAPGQKSITFMMDATVIAVAQYAVNGYALTVQSTPPTGLSISSSTGQNGTTNYTKTGVAYGTSVNLEAPATDPAGYTFSQWTLNGAAQTDGQKSVTFTMDAAVTAVAHYTPNTGYTLSVQSTPPTGDFISSSTFHSGITNYTVPGVTYGTSVNLQAPVTDPAGYTFSQWAVNGAAQTPGQKSITFTMDAAVKAVARYTPNTGYTLSVQSTPPVKLVLSSSTGHDGTTNYTKTGVGNRTSVSLQAPATDPAGYTFSQWMVNGAAQTPGQKSITFTMDAAVKAVARYTPNTGYTLSVHSSPPVKLAISSSTGHGGTTNYTKTEVAYGTNVNLTAPATDPAGYTFSQWTVNGAAQPAGKKSITFTMDAAMTAVAVYVKGG